MLMPFSVLFVLSVLAQTKTTTQTSTSTNTARNPQQTNTNSGTNTKNTQQKQQQPTLSSQTDSLKTAANDIKKSFNTLFNSKRDTIGIAITNVEYDDANLAQLKEQLKKVKGVRGVVMKYKFSSAVLEVSLNGKATDLWDKLPAETKTPFKIVEAGDNTLLLEPRN